MRVHGVECKQSVPNKGLLSVKKMNSMGHRVVFDQEGSYIQDKKTGEVIWLKEEGGMYMLKLWVKKPKADNPF